MYNFRFYSSFFNKIIALLMTISLLSVSFSFNFDKNIKQELNILYEATSVCEYYNSIANFSYVIINKILESTNINLTAPVSQKNKAGKEDKQQNNQNKLYFVKTTVEKELKVSQNFNNYNFSISKILFNKISYFNLLSNKFILKAHIFKLSCLTIFSCYFARDNIGENININNIIKSFRLV